MTSVVMKEIITVYPTKMTELISHGNDKFTGQGPCHAFYQSKLVSLNQKGILLLTLCQVKTTQFIRVTPVSLPAMTMATPLPL